MPVSDTLVEQNLQYVNESIPFLIEGVFDSMQLTGSELSKVYIAMNRRSDELLKRVSWLLTRSSRGTLLLASTSFQLNKAIERVKMTMPDSASQPSTVKAFGILAKLTQTIDRMSIDHQTQS